jgi:hypothetical protein
MIYLLKSIEGKHIYLKIGYLEKWKESYNVFRNNSDLNLKVLALIKEGTKGDELALHRHFKDYWILGGYGWFKFNDKIINFFKNNTTIEEIRKVVPPLDLSAQPKKKVEVAKISEPEKKQQKEEIKKK